MSYFGPRCAKFFCPLSIGKEYRVVGYHTGDFVGEVEGVDRTFARVLVIDPLRPRPRVKDRCSFPECVRKDFHNGDHEFASVREGALIEVSWESAKWIPVEASSGGEQLAVIENRFEYQRVRPGNKLAPVKFGGTHEAQIRNDVRVRRLQSGVHSCGLSHAGVNALSAPSAPQPVLHDKSRTAKDREGGMKTDRTRAAGFYWVRFEGASIVAEFVDGRGCSEDYPHWHVTGSSQCWKDKEVCELLSGKLEPAIRQAGAA